MKQSAREIHRSTRRVALEVQASEWKVLQWRDFEEEWNFVVFASYAVGWRRGGYGWPL